MTEQNVSNEIKDTESIKFYEFLESSPPSNLIPVSDIATIHLWPNGQYREHRLNLPELQLHCSHESCNGLRFFRCIENTINIGTGNFSFLYLHYKCSNCQKTIKTFSLGILVENSKVSDGKCYKFGEMPVFGPPTPARLIKLLGPDRETFLKGRRCENQGLGIGAFAYYRRVVENQKNRILDEIIKVSKKINTPLEAINILEQAKLEIQFSKSLALVKDSIPQILLINGRNPLTLLHSALSDGLHDKTDEHCLEIASSVRIILAELSDRLSQALKDEAELNLAVSRLMNSKT